MASEKEVKVLDMLQDMMDSDDATNDVSLDETGGELFVSRLIDGAYVEFIVRVEIL